MREIVRAVLGGKIELAGLKLEGSKQSKKLKLDTYQIY